MAIPIIADMRTLHILWTFVAILLHFGGQKATMTDDTAVRNFSNGADFYLHGAINLLLWLATAVELFSAMRTVGLLFLGALQRPKGS